MKDHELSATLATSGGDSKKVVAIGIAAWGCIDNSEALIDPSVCFVLLRYEIQISII